jgi:formylglycine-generating enzyme
MRIGSAFSALVAPALAFAAGGACLACSGGGPLPGAPPPPTPALPIALSASSSSPAPAPEAEAEAPLASDLDAGGPSACPAGMVLVDTTYCPKVRQRCRRDEYNKPNHLTICNEFAPGQVCLTAPRRQRFCIDTYEYPNQAGAHPPVMVDWYDSRAACAAQGKRLCWESEWVSACEGPDKLPFPYGYKRDADKCNIDNPYVEPDLARVYAKDRAAQDKELLKLDQSVASGELKGCVSGFGVHDLTGNFDEWVNAEGRRGKGEWAGLKGGAWGHVRNACRPMTVSHPPEFTYYFISFRCCADAAPDPEAVSDAGAPPLWTPPPPPDHPDPKGATRPGWTTLERGSHRPVKR